MGNRKTKNVCPFTERRKKHKKTKKKIGKKKPKNNRDSERLIE